MCTARGTRAKLVTGCVRVCGVWSASASDQQTFALCKHLLITGTWFFFKQSAERDEDEDEEGVEGEEVT